MRDEDEVAILMMDLRCLVAWLLILWIAATALTNVLR